MEFMQVISPIGIAYEKKCCAEESQFCCELQIGPSASMGTILVFISVMHLAKIHESLMKIVFHKTKKKSANM